MKKLALSLSASVLALGLAPAVQAADAELMVFEWAGWGIPELTAEYNTKHGDTPSYAFFADDDEAFQKVSSGFQADLVHPCSQQVSKYRDAGLIEPWDVSRIPEYANIAPRFKESPIFADDKGVWFIPTDYAYTAVAYNTKDVTAEEVATLNVFKDPKFAGRVSLPDNTDDVWSLALLATGVSNWSSVTDEQFAAAAAWLREVHPNVRSYWSDPAELAQLMGSGEVQLAWSWNDAVAIMRSEGFPVAFQRQTTEGSATWFCGFVNIKDAPGSEDKAYDFINAMLAHPTAKVFVDNFGYAHANDAALATIPAEDLVKADLNAVEGTLLSQTPIDHVMRDRMLAEFELIKSGF